MVKEKFIVCMGIFLILAILTSCAFYYGSSNSAVVRNDMEISGKIISFGANEGTVLSARSETPMAPCAAAFIN